MTREERLEVREDILRDAIAWGVAEVSHIEIDEINILNASFKAMHLALAQLSMIPQLLLIDGNRFKPYLDLPFECVVKGDGRFFSIAAASVIAKTYRDELMQRLGYTRYVAQGGDWGSVVADTMAGSGRLTADANRRNPLDPVSTCTFGIIWQAPVPGTQTVTDVITMFRNCPVGPERLTVMAWTLVAPVPSGEPSENVSPLLLPAAVGADGLSAPPLPPPQPSRRMDASSAVAAHHLTGAFTGCPRAPGQQA